MEKIRNLSLRKSIVLYVTVSLTVSFFLTALVKGGAERIQQNIWGKYIGEEYERLDQILMEAQEEPAFYMSFPRPAEEEMTGVDQFFSELCDFLQTWSQLFISTAGCVTAVFLFYRNKIKEPLEELTEGAERISKEDLEFSLTYKNRDEMGRLCTEFEKMRRQLVENNRKMWEMVEQEKALRSAIAHDIRSPLTVLKGYQEMILEFVPGETLEKEQLLEMLRAGMDQIERMDHFVDTMRTLAKLEERTVIRREVSLKEIREQMEKTAQMMGRDSQVECRILGVSEGTAEADLSIVYEVYDNLLSNALRYAREKIVVVLSADEKRNRLEIKMSDDGTGFTEDFEKVTKAYYHANPQGDLQHFGLGLYLCRIYCEKHGGELLIGNAVQGGAEIRARFRMGLKQQEEK